MSRTVIVCIIGLAALSSCHLTEAEQKDTSRDRIESVDSSATTEPNDRSTPTVSYRGGNAIPLSELLTARRGMDYSSIFQVDDPEGCHSVNCWTWELAATRDGKTLISFRASSDHFVRLWEFPEGNEWADNLSDIKWQLFRATGNGWDDGWIDTYSNSASLLKIVDDRIPVSLRFLGDSSRFKSGDTIRIEMVNKSLKDTTLAASDYSGMRMVGKYDAKLGPGDSATFQWLVLATPGNSAWLEISWSRAGQSKRFTFPIQ